MAAPRDLGREIEPGCEIQFLLSAWQFVVTLFTLDSCSRRKLRSRVPGQNPRHVDKLHYVLFSRMSGRVSHLAMPIVSGTKICCIKEPFIRYHRRLSNQ